MVSSREQKMNQHWFLRMPLVVFAAVALALFPDWSGWFVYDREAILSGEFWRMFTGQYVHLSTSHLIYNLLGLGLAGWMLGQRELSGLGWFYTAGPFSISTGVLLLEPEMRFCF